MFASHRARIGYLQTLPVHAVVGVAADPSNSGVAILTCTFSPPVVNGEKVFHIGLVADQDRELQRLTTRHGRAG